VPVPPDNRLPGAEAFGDVTRVLARSRQGVAWEALGHAVAAYEIALEHASRREQFGRPRAAFQLVQERLVRMLVAITGVQMMCWRMARLEQEGKVTAAISSAAKLHAAATARRVVLEARAILGGDGILLDHHIARHHGDIEAVYTYEGTHEMNTLIVGREITGHPAFAGG
jgi:glutaryl-CoA dehydrogenase